MQGVILNLIGTRHLVLLCAIFHIVTHCNEALV